jgi:pantetheine-phosphate adenylyltransferase
VTKGVTIFTGRFMTKAFYPGSFDPMTNGHLDVLIQALSIASKSWSVSASIPARRRFFPLSNAPI